MAKDTKSRPKFAFRNSIYAIDDKNFISDQKGFITIFFCNNVIAYIKECILQQGTYSVITFQSIKQFPVA